MRNRSSQTTSCSRMIVGPAQARTASIYKDEKFSDHAPYAVEYA